MSLFAHFEAHAGERRRSVRRTLRLGVGAAGESVTIRDLSLSGMLLETLTPMLVGARFQVELPQAGAVGAVVTWTSGAFYGCEFDFPIASSVLSAALLQSPFETAPDSSKAAVDAASELRQLNAEMDRIAAQLDRTIERLRRS